MLFTPCECVLECVYSETPRVKGASEQTGIVYCFSKHSKFASAGFFVADKAALNFWNDAYIWYAR